jgi:catechol 2,3-dioxygenase-like lactoylglutathione lyase family enzyme
LPDPNPSLANLAFKVDDLGAAAAFFEGAPGCRLVDRYAFGENAFIQGAIGETIVNVFTTALYDDEGTAAAPGVIHMSFHVDDLDEAMAAPVWRDTKVVWGPHVIEGYFGRRRVIFYEPMQCVRIELMEALPE